MVEKDLNSQEILDFFKAMGDANRLKLLGLLAQQDLTVEQLSEMINLRPSTVSHHLSKLSEVGLVSAKASSYYNIYHLENKVLETMAKKLLSKDTLPTMASDINMDAFDQKVVRDYSLPDGQLKTIPAQRKKLDVLLRHISKSFQPGITYSEYEVNQILKKYHADTTTLRRELIGIKLLNRSSDGSKYWLESEQT
ncbi:MAG: metalloregulator ArsR/SmtB family transcription factor [Anaerolineales bacterium]|jgi:predicted transcriptional regulator